MTGRGRLASKRAVVIGAGSVGGGEGLGNGRAAALLFAREGAAVMAVDRDGAAAAATCARIAAEGGTAHAVTGDMTDPADVAALTEEVAALWGGAEIVHFNIGTSVPGGVAETDPAEWDRVFSVNLRAAYLCARALLPALRVAGGGSMVFVSSLAATWSGPYSYAAYEASKAGLNRLARILARAHAGEGIRANVVMPGLIDTPHVTAHIAGTQPGASAEARAALAPMGRQGTPWEVAEAALFLASDAASYVTGAVLPVDGGLSA